MLLGYLPYLVTGIVVAPSKQWQESPYIIKLKEIFEETWESDSSKHYTSAIGCLHAIGDKLYPKFIGMQEDGETEGYEFDIDPILLSDLALSDEELKDVKENGYLIISKFERKEIVD